MPKLFGPINDSLAVGDRSLAGLLKKIRQLAVVLYHRKQAITIDTYMPNAHNSLWPVTSWLAPVINHN